MTRRWIEEPEISARLMRPFRRMLRDRGVFLEPVVGGVNVEDPDARLRHRLAISLLDHAAQGTGDEAIGLHAAERLEPGDFDVLEYAAMSSATVGESIVTANRYLRLVHDAAEFSLDSDGTTAVWRYRFPSDLPMPPLAAEYFVAILVILARRFVDGDVLRGAEVQFTHPKPRDVREHERILRVDLRFDQSQNAIVLPARTLDLPLKKSDPALKTLLERVAGEMLQKLPQAGTLTSHVRRLLAAELRGGDPRIGYLAKKLHTTPRTLRRRLEETGTTHREILEELRRELALQYLAERALGTAEVAFLLGYSNASAFLKAFRRWTGMSPSEYRRREPSTRSRTQGGAEGLEKAPDR